MFTIFGKNKKVESQASYPSKIKDDAEEKEGKKVECHKEILKFNLKE